MDVLLGLISSAQCKDIDPQIWRTHYELIMLSTAEIAVGSNKDMREALSEGPDPIKRFFEKQKPHRKAWFWYIVAWSCWLITWILMLSVVRL